MTAKQCTMLDFLTLNDLVDEVVHFAESNNYQHPIPSPAFIEEFNNAMKGTLVIYEQIRVMPGYLPKVSLETLSNDYTLTFEGLSMLMIACPDPDAALGWFDYQKQYKSRVQQLKNVTALLDWQQSIYLAIVDRVPELPIPLRASTLEQPLSVENTQRKTNPEGDSYTSNGEAAKLYL